MKKTNITIDHSSVNLISIGIYCFSNLLLKKMKIYFLLITFFVSSFNVFAQTSSLISTCGDFVAGSVTAWPYVLEATTLSAGAASQASQTYTMNVISLPAGGANVRVYKTTANGSSFFGNPIALTLGSNSITVSAVTFDRAVKFQFSSGDVEFDALSLNGVASTCVAPLPPSSTSLISLCSDFITGPAAWPYVLVATTIADGVASQASQTFTINVTSLPAGGANFRVYKTTANGNSFFGNAVALTLGSNSITVAAVTFDRAVKFQFSSGDVEFDALSLNGVASTCVAPLPPPSTSLISVCSDFISGPAAWPYVLEATTIADGAVSQASQTFTMNVTSLPAGGANFRVFKTTANGNSFFGNAVALTLGSNSITVAAVTFDRAVKFQFSSGDVEFDALSLNGVSSTCVCSSSSIDTISSCDHYTWIDGNTYTSSNNTATYTLVNSDGCDSTITLNLTIRDSSSSSIYITSCNSYDWNGFTYTNSGTFTQTLTNVNGCDSLVTLNLTINNSPSASIINITSCDSYNWNGFIFTTSGIYTQTLTNVDGCDSIVTLNLTINGLSSSSSTNVISCDSYDWNGTTFTSSGIYSWTGTNTDGCDSIATLNLTINNSSSSSINITACQSYDWNGNTYTSSGTYTWTGVNSLGCDSTASLILVITSNSTTSNISVCNNYTWNGITYSSSGVYTYNNGTCIDSLILTINNSSSSSTVISSCDDYNWNGNTYTSSGIYTWVGSNIFGCDSVVVLDLIINNSSSSSTVISSCDDYNWNGNTYTSSGIYTWLGSNIFGCDSVAVLDLTINNFSLSYDTVLACDSLNWNGITYTSSGLYTWTGTNSLGCDSIANIDLTITTIDSTINLVNDSTLQVQSNNTGNTYQWLDCNNSYSPIIGETNNTFITQNPGYYAVEISLNGCSVISACYSIISTSITDAFALDYEVKIFPNPTSNYLTILLEEIDKVDITILDLQGKIIYQRSGVLNNDEINFSSNVDGNYIIKVTSPFGVKEMQIIKY